LEKEESGTSEAVVNGERSLVVFNRMKLGWKTVSVVPFNYVLADARQASNRLLFISAISILLAIILIFLTSRYFSNRFLTLYRFIRKVGNEDFNFQLRSSGSDEIGQLANAFNDMKLRLDEQINEVYKKEILKKEAELYALQSQINPHFLYNTLSIISSHAFRNKDTELGSIVKHLSNFYKTTLNQGKRNILILKELDITRHYIAIQHMRFEKLFQVHWQIDQSLYVHQTLKLMLQPFVENAINHAVWDHDRTLTIIIRLYKSNNSICFEVVDDGSGMTEEQSSNVLQANKESGYGIRNVHERIQLAYGSNYGVAIYSRLGIGTQVVITIPLDE
jgi:two-component system, sensor histidine kinase YesM